MSKRRKAVMLTLEQLRSLVLSIEAEAVGNEMSSCVYVTMSDLPTGEAGLHFEQPSSNPGCASRFYRFRNMGVDELAQRVLDLEKKSVELERRLKTQHENCEADNETSATKETA